VFKTPKFGASKNIVDEDVPLEVRNSRSRIIPYLMEAERRDMRSGKFAINGRIYELDWLLKKMQ
jgi:hypothetical protein